MENKIFLENFEPFKDMFFTSCKYSSCLSLAKYYKKDALPILANPIFNYEFDEKSSIIRVKINEAREIHRILIDMGISIHLKWPDADNLKNEILTSLSSGYPTSISIDMYYQPGRIEYYNKNHGLGHQVVVFGYDPDKDMFHTIDDMNGMDKYTISRKDLENCYRGMLESGGFGPGNKCAFFEFRVNPDKNVSTDKSESSMYSCIADFADNMLSRKDIILQSLESLAALEEAFDRIIKNETFIGSLHSSKDRRLSESYRFLRILECFKNDSDTLSAYSKIESLGNEIADNFVQIRNMIAREVYSNEFSMETCIKSKKLVNEIHNKEVQFYDIFFSVIDKWKNEEWYTSLRQEVPA
jgi:hypothetical protein